MVDIITEGKKLYLSQKYSGICVDITELTNNDLENLTNLLLAELQTREGLTYVG